MPVFRVEFPFNNVLEINIRMIRCGLFNCDLKNICCVPTVTSKYRRRMCYPSFVFLSEDFFSLTTRLVFMHLEDNLVLKTHQN